MSKESIEIQSLEKGYSCQTLYVSGNSFLSGNININSPIVSQNSHLILSSSAGSNIHASGTISLNREAQIIFDEALQLSASAIGKLKVQVNALTGSILDFTQGKSIADPAVNSAGVGFYCLDGTTKATIVGKRIYGENFFVDSGIGGGITTGMQLDHTGLQFYNADTPIISWWNTADGNSGKKDLKLGKTKIHWLYMSGASGSVGLMADSGELMLSSSLSSLVVFSASTDFANSDLPYHIKSRNSDLILSSSSTSIVTVSGNLRTNGFRIGYREVGAQYTLVPGDCFIEARADTGSFGIVLPTAIGNVGKQYHIKKCDASANTVIVSGSSGQLIDGVAIQTIATQWTSISVISNNVGWLIF